MEVVNNLLYHIHELEVIVIRLAILLCDAIGVLVLSLTVIKGTIGYFRKKHDINVKLTLAQGIALALEFKLAAEVLRTVTVRELSELIILGTIILLRVGITLLIHWEIKSEKAEEERERSLQLKNPLEETKAAAVKAKQ